MDGRIALAWSPRPQPLIARAVAATGDAAVALGKRLAALDDAALARLTAVAHDGALTARTAERDSALPARTAERDSALPARTAERDSALPARSAEHDSALPARAGGHDLVLVVLGDADALPWVDGVEYLGRDVSAPDLLLPTARAPTVPAPALQHAVVARAAATRGAAPYALWRSDGVLRLVPCGPARAIDRARLATWLTKTSLAAAEVRP